MAKTVLPLQGHRSDPWSGTRAHKLVPPAPRKKTAMRTSWPYHVQQRYDRATRGRRTNPATTSRPLHTPAREPREELPAQACLNKGPPSRWVLQPSPSATALKGGVGTRSSLVITWPVHPGCVGQASA